MAVAAQWHGAPVEAEVLAAAERGVYEACEVLLAHSLQRTPFVEGDLRQSAVASAEGTRGMVSYNTPYARRQHEELGYHHPIGEAKFLEKAANEFGPEFLAIVQARVRQAL